MAPAQVRVALVEDHPIYRHALEHLIAREEGLAFVTSFASGAEIASAIEHLQADVVLVDLNLPDIDGLSVLRRMVPARPDLRFVVLTGDCDTETTYAALEAGAVGYLVKDLDERALLRAIVAVADGELVIPRRLQLGVAREIRSRAAQNGPRLTAREREVLALTAEGLTAPEAARRLHVSTGTVKAHLSSVYEKLDAPDRAAAVARAMRLGILT